MRNKVMIEKLYDQYQRGYIHNTYECNFIMSMKALLDLGRTLTAKQEKVLEDIFDRN